MDRAASGAVLDNETATTVMASPLPSGPVEATRHALQQSLPTCHRCRRLRRKCDTQLPSCRMCEKAGAECTFYDHALKQTLPRAYVQSLLTRVAHLEAVKNGNANFSSGPLPSSAGSARPLAAIDSTPQTPKTAFRAASPSFDVIIPSRSTAGKWRYWGASSVFALTVEILHNAAARSLISADDLVEDGDPVEEHGNDQDPYTRAIAPDTDIHELVQLYLVSLNTLYGFVDPTETSADLQAYLSLREQRALSPWAIQGDDVHRYFRITMMCAISCANQARYRPHRAAESLAYYADAVACVEEVTSEASAASLQALLLLIVFCLFYPRKGDIWKMLDYACRLTVELGYHTERQSGQVDATDIETEPQSKLRRSTFWGLYAIERIVGQLFGRGSDLPETIITTEYPSSLHPGIGQTAMPSVDQPTLQSMSIAHHYRLVYLRSEIFRSMYLPASPPDLSLDWLKDRYTTLHMWRQELAVSDELEGVATLTCDVGYDATMCFLFQPLLLRALSTTVPPAVGSCGVETESQARELPSHGEAGLIASDPFHSAINLIRTYEKVIRAPQRSVLGTYPMTFLSAHYIYLASSTLLAYALLRLEGRTKTLRRMSDAERLTEEDTEELDWGAFIDVSSSCLILLAWCGERWPGMLGMLGVYQRLFNRVVRELIGKGIVR
ncbi:Positive regulator of purine utilization [Pleurostoma richardsiae]|uniref:Positive regulator of purine utilization n=1 Tax=Pleurostoma richardsiae TaxID=41990 RepID=A0AA38VKJ4_9PEZI|nr:Positive regulator of purine utilization [Pleurostoma richardsiae]